MIDIHQLETGILALEGTELSDTIQFALSCPPGHGVINELCNDGPYRQGPIPSAEVRQFTMRIRCPYCRVPIKIYQYPQLGLSVYLCKEIGFFVPITSSTRMTRKLWLGLLQQSASLWVKVEASRASGQS